MINTSQQHFARVLRPPGIREEAPGCFRLTFFEPWRMAYETAVINAMVCALCWFAYRLAHHWLVWIPVIPVFVLYLVIAQCMYRQSLRLAAGIIHGHLHVGVPGMKNLGRIREVLCIDVSGPVVGENSSDGTSRIYLTLEDNDGKSAVVLFLLSGGSCLRPLARKIASAAGCPYRQGWGAAFLPPSPVPFSSLPVSVPAA